MDGAQGGTVALLQPRSWAEDLQTYRTSRGSKAFATCTSSKDAGLTVGRTALVPFLDTTHRLYSYDDYRDGGAQVEQRAAVKSLRYKMHGWGDVSMLKQDGKAAIPETTARSGKAQCSGLVAGAGMQAVLQQTEAGGVDSWVGHPLIQPGKGRRAGEPQADASPGRNLFHLLSSQHPGRTSDDSWLGHPLINPAKGKAHPPGPEQRRGRRDLTDTFTQSILREPNKAELLRKGVDPLADAWCGHPLINPSLGKAPPSTETADLDLLIGASFKPPVPADWSDFKRPHAKAVPPPVPDSADRVLNGTAPLTVLGPGERQGGKKFVPETIASRQVQRTDLYAHLTFRPLSEVESKVYSKAFNDGRSTGRLHAPHVPGDAEHGKGSGLLAWHPEESVGNFVPYAGLAQVGRKVKSAVPGGTMGRPMPIPRALSNQSIRNF